MNTMNAKDAATAETNTTASSEGQEEEAGAIGLSEGQISPEEQQQAAEEAAAIGQKQQTTTTIPPPTPLLE
jgi:hypothetical protein